MSRYTVIGVMSGTSLDGLDIALCQFEKKSNKWNFRVLEAETDTYSPEWKQQLTYAVKLSGQELIKLDSTYGAYIGEKVNQFLKKHPIRIDFISSHGHTVYHQPEKRVTLQIGNGADILAISGITTISNFRSVDVALGGQGAPLVPVGDELLFDEYKYCLNLGGIANISFKQKGKRIASDICPVNMAINYLMQKVNKEIDKDGEMAQAGILIPHLLVQLNNLAFYKKPGPKSLGREWFESEFMPILDKYDFGLRDLLRTTYEHIATQITLATESSVKKPVLITGGGAHNKFLIDLLKAKTNHQIIIPDKQIIDFKEALVFAFLGVLRMRHEINCLASVTGAKRDSVGGCVYGRVKGEI